VPRQNRVTPFGDVIATPARGTFFGNRGVLHDATGRIRRPWQNRRWLICLLAFKDRWRPPMTPGHYTGLFFLDEATALAAGHRPCAECRRERFNAYRTAWAKAVRRDGPTAGGIDDRLHAERLTPHNLQRTYPARLDELPDGVFVRLGPSDSNAYLIWAGRLVRWAAGGYAGSILRQRRQSVEVLTPRSTVGAIRCGYAPAVHPSAVGHSYRKASIGSRREAFQAG